MIPYICCLYSQSAVIWREYCSSERVKRRIEGFWRVYEDICALSSFLGNRENIMKGVLSILSILLGLLNIPTHSRKDNWSTGLDLMIPNSKLELRQTTSQTMNSLMKGSYTSELLKVLQ